MSTDRTQTVSDSVVLRAGVYDIFRHDEGVELVAWLNDTTRADQLTLNPHRRASTGQPYLGTFGPKVLLGNAEVKMPLYRWGRQSEGWSYTARYRADGEIASIEGVENERK